MLSNIKTLFTSSSSLSLQGCYKTLTLPDFCGKKSGVGSQRPLPPLLPKWNEGKQEFSTQPSRVFTQPRNSPTLNVFLVHSGIRLGNDGRKQKRDFSILWIDRNLSSCPPPHSGPVFCCKIVTMSVIVIIYNCTILCIDWNLGLCTI